MKIKIEDRKSGDPIQRKKSMTMDKARGSWK